ncbi:hypothetical protein ZWY2020_030334 [Hordeum vulgare]|nr:hypothetical protein ZWY2020_030334 [Hordeum vulgare]
MDNHMLACLLASAGLPEPTADALLPDSSEQIYIAPVALLKMLKHARAGVPIEVIIGVVVVVVPVGGVAVASGDAGGADGEGAGAAEFGRRAEELGRVQHPNMVAVQTYFHAKEERQLVYDYYPNGSLFSLFHGQYTRLESSSS